MHIFRLSFSLFLFSLISFATFSQTGTLTIGSISGKLTDAKNNPVSYATVTLLRTDMSVVNGDLTKDDGSFKIAPTGVGTFKLRIESIGITTKTIDVSITADAPDKKLGTIKVAEEENKLGEVSVVGEKRVMELKVDKKVFNVDKNTTTAGGSATDVLQNVPAVSVDADGNVSLRGKTGVTILIDGKPATMLGSDVASALQSLPAGSIETVEVITNPSAKYDAQGTSGIINIVTKKDGRFGMNGAITLGAGTRDKYNGNLSLNVRKGKWSAFMNSSFRINNTFNNVTTHRRDKDTSIGGNIRSYYTYEHVPRAFNGTFNTIGATFDPNKYNSFTVTQNINLMEFSFRDYSDYYVYGNPDESGTALFHQNRNSSFYGSPFSLSSAIDYKHKFKKKDEELSIDGTYATTAMRRNQEYTTNNYPSVTPNPIRERAPGIGDNSTLTVWADYTDPLFTKNGKLGIGFKSQFYAFNSSNNPIIDSPGIGEKVDSSLLSSYDYTQQIHAAYVNWSDQMGKFSYQAGLRVEDAVYDGTGNVPRRASFSNNFFNFFPSAFISYQLANQQSVYLNYSRRTNRPGFMQLLPFVDVSNPSTVNKGNPNLIPEFINNIEFSYSKSDNKGNNIILSTYYAYTENLIERLTRPIKPDEAALYGVSPGNLFTQPVNIASGATYGLEGTGHIQIIPIWDATVNLNFFHNQLIIGNIDTAYSKFFSNNNGYTYFAKVNSNLKLPKNFSFQFNGNYESAKVIAQGNLAESYWLDLALKKTFWKSKATLVINCSDVFKTRRFITNYNINVYNQSINRVKETRIGNITFTYKFGKSDMGKSKEGRKDKPDEKMRTEKPKSEDRDKNLKEGDDNDQGGGQGGGGNNKGNKGNN